MTVHKNPKLTGFNGEFPTVRNIVLTSDTDSITFDNLAGDQAFMYRITGAFTIVRVGGADSMLIPLTINGDSGANYRYVSSELEATYTGTTSSSKTAFQLLGPDTEFYPANTSGIMIIDIFAETDAVSRVIKAEVFVDDGVAGKTIISTGSYDVGTEVTSITLDPIAAGGTGYFESGSRFQLSAMGVV